MVPGYISTAFKDFCVSYKILHTTGIPYNPQGQAIVEQAHQTLKLQLQRQEGRDSSLATEINKALFTLNFFNCSESGFSPAEKHWEHCNKQHLPQVLWKDVMTGAWQSPSPVLLWAEAMLLFFLKVQKAQFGYLHSS
jgi:transposase InsO family protein